MPWREIKSTEEEEEVTDFGFGLLLRCLLFCSMCFALLP